MPAKILINGVSNSGKTTLLKTLKNALVVSRDGKPFSLPIAHVNMPDTADMNEFLTIVDQKLDGYKEKFKSYPDTIVFDSISKIFTEIVVNCTIKYDNFKIWENVDKEVQKFLNAINDIQTSMGLNVILIEHIVFDTEAKRLVEVLSGKFAKRGFIADVDYALTIEIIGKKRVITHRNTPLSRTHLTDLPDKQDSEDFNLQEYVDKVNVMNKDVVEKWSL